MPILIAFGTKGLSLDHIVHWDDYVLVGENNQLIPCLTITFAVPAATPGGSTVPHTLTYRDGERVVLLEVLRDYSRSYDLPEPFPTEPPATEADDTIPGDAMPS